MFSRCFQLLLIISLLLFFNKTIANAQNIQDKVKFFNGSTDIHGNTESLIALNKINIFQEVEDLGNTNNKDKIYFQADEINSKGDIITLRKNASLYLPEYQLELEANIIKLNKLTKILTATGHVLIKVQDNLIHNDYFELDLEKKISNIQEIETFSKQAKITAKTAELEDKDKYITAVYRQGEIITTEPIRISTGSIYRGTRRGSFRFLKNQSEQDSGDIDKRSYILSANQVKYTPDRVQNNIFLSRPRVEFKNFPVPLILPSWFLTAGESSEQMLTPLIGNTPKTGAGDFNIGPQVNLVIGDPKKEQTFRFAPFFQMGDNLGYGGMLKYDTKRLDALLAYGSSKDRGLAEVSYKLNKNTNLAYGWNSYTGGGITEQFASLQNTQSLEVPFIRELFEGEAIYFFNSLSGFKDSEKLRREENNRISDLQTDALTDNKLEQWGARYESVLSARTKPLIELGNTDNNIGFNILLSSRFRAYTTGNLLGTFSFTPNVRLHLNKFLDLETGYSSQLISGESPFGFDQIVEGQSSVYNNFDLNLFSWLTIGGQSTYSFTRDEFVSQEARIIVGPEDCKLLVGYDPVFQRINVGINILLPNLIKYGKLSYFDRK